MSTEPATATAGADANPYARYSNVALADALGDIDVALKAAKARQELAREEMERRHLSSLDGARFVVTRDVKTENRFDSAAAKKTMGLAWYQSFQKPNSRTTYTVTPRAPEQLGVPA